MRRNSAQLPIGKPGSNGADIQFVGQIQVRKIEEGLGKRGSQTPYDLTLKCVNGIIPRQFLISSPLDEVILDTDSNGKPSRFSMTDRDLEGKFRFVVEFELDQNGDPTSLKFYLPPNGQPVNRKEDLTDIRQTDNLPLAPDAEIADRKEIEAALAENPFLETAYSGAEFHLNVALFTLASSLTRAKKL